MDGSLSLLHPAKDLLFKASAIAAWLGRIRGPTAGKGWPGLQRGRPLEHDKAGRKPPIVLLEMKQCIAALGVEHLRRKNFSWLCIDRKLQPHRPSADGTVPARGAPIGPMVVTM